jgi:hypothetical protein
MLKAPPGPTTLGPTTLGPVLRRMVSGRLLTAMPARTVAAPAICGKPNGSPKATTPAAAPTSGSRFRNVAAVAAETRACP